MTMYSCSFSDDYVFLFIFRGSVKNTCKMLMALGLSTREVYEDDFEKPLLKESREFYRVSEHSIYKVFTCKMKCVGYHLLAEC